MGGADLPGLARHRGTAQRAVTHAPTTSVEGVSGYGVTKFQGTNAGYYDREMTRAALLANWDIVPDHSGYTEFDNGYESLSMVQTARENATNRET